MSDGESALPAATVSGFTRRKAVKLALYLLLMAAMALPLFGVRVPRLLPYLPLLVIHELSGFLFFGHTLFSNIWSMRLRQTQGLQTGIWARAFIRRLALGITLPTTVITPLAGLMLVEEWGGLRQAAWAFEAYFCFWVMAGISLWPDLIRLAIDEHADEPTHGMMGGAVRGMGALFLTIYIIYCMVTKQALFAG